MLVMSRPICFCVSKIFFKKFKNVLYFSLLQINIFFGIFKSFWCANVKKKLKIKKYIILIYFLNKKYF